MNLVLTEKMCKTCQARLTEYEIENNEGLCIDCYKDSQNNEEK
ncbi:YhfH-like protein [Brevibacillus invocatus]